MAQIINLGDWHELTVDKATSLYLYGVDPPPPDLFDRIRDASSPNNDITVTLNAASFMADRDSPARYALPSLSPFVSALFGNLSSSFPQLSGIQGSATVEDLILNYHVDPKAFSISIRQAYVATGSPDYADRTYIWNSESFTLRDDTKFVFSDINNPSDPNFVPHIENLRVLPFDDNFDFASNDPLAGLGGTFVLQPAIDPYNLGQQVQIKFTPESKASIPGRNYGPSDFGAET